MTRLLLGATGFVGSSLLRQAKFDVALDSKTIARAYGQHFSEVFCAAAPGKKWLANQDPLADRANMAELIASLERISCDAFVLISTVDVYDDARGVDERVLPDPSATNAYGLHRKWLEDAVRAMHPDALIVRLPGLVGPGLRKNFLFDLHHRRATQSVPGNARFQFYPMVNLMADIDAARRHQLKLVHLTSPALTAREIDALCDSDLGAERLDAAGAPDYDLQSCHAHRFGQATRYTYSRVSVETAMRAYFQGEPRFLPGDA